MLPHTTVIDTDTDTCDKCGPTTRAYLYAKMPSGLTLAYCGSCGTRYIDALRQQGATIVDQRHAIQP